MFLNLLGISDAVAASGTAAAHTPGESLLSALPMLIIFVAVFYFLLIRPQQKRAKEQRSLLDGLSIGDEVVTAGGIVGKIAKLRDDFIILSITKEVEITVQKNSISTVLPKGSVEPQN